ncbi:MAG: glycerate kinase [Bifidobacteriaceae bacterium]|jgi:glycerate kinase|nr:glycerate kinase [Bifidobacteriaceae bacterium]
MTKPDADIPPRPGSERRCRVVIAPDSLKGSLGAVAASAALRCGWLAERPFDDVICLPQADGGEGTAEVLASVFPGASWREVGLVAGPVQAAGWSDTDAWPPAVGAGVPGRYVALPDGTAVVDLATSSGIGLAARLDPLGAHTYGLGQVLRAAIEDGAQGLVIGLGGSASTDGGSGALAALGAGVCDRRGANLPLGGGALRQLGRIDRAGLVPPPPGGVDLLVDVNSPLLGPRGAAAVFGPQKGASPGQIAQLEAGLERLARMLGGRPDQAGAGAAGGTGFGLAAAWGARIIPGARRVAELTGLAPAVASADVLILAEGRLDATSLVGKVVGEALALAGPAVRHVVAGQVALPGEALPGVGLTDLCQLAGSRERALAAPAVVLKQAAAAIAAGLSV